ncbi:MAG: response regulator, partial [Alphaproteobacteria bacterium]
ALHEQAPSPLEWQIKPLRGLQGARILLVEDNRINQQVAEALLSQAGLHVSMAMNGREALFKVQQERYDAILMDIQMPEMDGYAATRAMRAIPELAGLPIIAMTANAMAEESEKCLEAGMNAHLAKPIEPDRLFRVLLQWIPVRESVPVRSNEASAFPPPNAVETSETLSLPGIDWSFALGHLGGNSRLLRKLLLDFHHDHVGDALEIRQALASGDLARAQRITHTLKGITGTIGAATLHQISKELND